MTDQASFGRRQTNTEKYTEDTGDRATSISTVVSKGIKYLEERDLLLLTGKEGIGKTFNALEIIKHFCIKHQSFEMLQLSSQNKRGPNYFSNKEFCSDGNTVVLLDNFLGRDNILYVRDDLKLLEMIIRKRGQVKIILIVEEATKALCNGVFTTSDLLSNFSVIDLNENMNRMTERERSEIIRKICTNTNDETIKEIEHRYAISEKEAALPLLCNMFTSVPYLQEQGEMFFLNPKLCVTRLVDLLRERGSSSVVAATSSTNEDEDAIFFAVLIQILITEKLFVYQLFNDTTKNIENIIAVVFGKSLSLEEIELEGIINKRNSSLICRTSEGKGVYYYLNNHLLRNALVQSFLSLGLQNVLPTLSLNFIVKYLKPSTERRNPENSVTCIDEDDFEFICSRIIDVVCVDKINNDKGVSSVKTLCTSLFVHNEKFVDTLLQKYVVAEASVRKALSYEEVYLTSSCTVKFYFPAVLLKTIVKHGYNFRSVRILKKFLSTMLCLLNDDAIIKACSQTIAFTLSKECLMKNIQCISLSMELIKKHDIDYASHTGSILHNACKSRDEQLIDWVLGNVDLERAFTYIGRKILSCSNTIDDLKFMLKVLQKRQTNQLYFYLMLEMVCDISHKDLAMYMFEHFPNEIIKGYCELYNEILEENALKSLLRELMQTTIRSWQSNIHLVEWLLQNFKPNKEYFDMKDVKQFLCTCNILQSN